jgi:hypothetical protein
MRRAVGGVSGLVRRPTALLALACALALAPAAQAALVTQVASGGEKDKAVAVNLDLQWTYFLESGAITRQFYDTKSSTSYQADELNYTRATNVLNLAAHFGVARDFELHVNLPWVVQDAQYWQYAVVKGVSVQGSSTIQNNQRNAHNDCINGTDANGNCTGPPTPLFPVPGTVYRAGISDPTVGFSWAIFNDARANHLPETWFPPIQDLATWVVGIDYTFPVASVMNPFVTNPGTPNTGSYLPIGLGEHRLDFWTAMSKRVGMFEPFFKLHYLVPFAASNAYNNCYAAGKDTNQLVMTNEGQTLCGEQNVTVPAATENGQALTLSNPWLGQTGLQPSQVGGVAAGFDFHAFDNKEGQSLSLSLQLMADYISKGRNYSELSDELHKLTYTDQYFDLGGTLTVDFRFSKYIHWVTTFSLSTYTPHTLTMEVVGQDLNGDQKVTLDTPEVNPNYDFRIDQPGRQFSITNVSVVGLSTRLTANF